jgi:hypothetical protein
MTAKLHRVHIPNVGECMVSQGSGYPYAAASLICPSGLEIGEEIRFGKKSFTLAKTGGALTSIGLGAKNGLQQGVKQCALTVDAAIGATSVTLLTVNTDGAAGTGLIALDEFKGGEIVLFKAGVDTPVRRGIIGNTARAATGSVAVTFYLDSPLNIALTTSDAGEAMQNPWSYVVHDTEIGHPVVGVPTVPASAAGMYLWLQTRGLCFVSPQSGVGVAGAGIGCYWRHDGSIDTYANIGAYVSTQYAGFVAAESLTHTQGAPFFFLQID